MTNCTKCSLHEYAITNCMKGTGSGKFLIVLPGPSASDDLAGSYSGGGRSGKLLTQLLRESGYSPEDTSIAYATRCRTARADRIGTPNIDSCREYLAEEILRIRPSAIIAMGDVALRALCKVSGIKAKRGSSLPLHDSLSKSLETAPEVWPTYAPDEVIRVPTYRKTVTSDLRRVRDSETDRPRVEWSWYPGGPLPESDYYAFDIETNYYDTIGNDTPEKITQIAIAGRNFTWVATTYLGGSDTVPASANGTVLELASLLCGKENIVGHNSWAFDIPKLKQHGVHLSLGHDTMYYGYLDDETQALKLESMAVKYLGVRGWKDEIDNAVGTDDFAIYNARDVQYTLQLFTALNDVLGARVRTIELILRPARIALDAQKERGIWIDPEPIARERAIAEETRDKSLAILREIAGPDFNPGSSKQVGEYLTSIGEKLPSTASGKPATGVEVLKGLLNA